MPARPVAPEPGARSLDLGWRFHSGDISPTPIVGHLPTYFSAKAGYARDAAAPEYDDSEWRTLDLPHDFVIERAPDPAGNVSLGYRPRGVAWYRRALRLDPAMQGRYLEIRFGAIAVHATIWVNGQIVAHNWSGYNGITIDITPLARFGDNINSIVVRADAEAIETWWYEGGGIYRHSWLIDRSPVHIVTDGVHADPRRLDTGAWHIPVVATLYNSGERTEQITVASELIDPAGRVLATNEAIAAVEPLKRAELRLNLAGFGTPRLWSVDDPVLYSVRTKLLRDGRTMDERTTPAGFRTVRFDAQRGFFLNDQPLHIQGVCIHDDHGGVGVAVPASLIEWRVRQLKALGCNAIRCAHNAPDTALLDACDRLGMMVMDENRLFNVAPDYMAQLEWLVRRDRNRPCIILWSVFNEEPMQGTPEGYEMVRRMASVVKSLDDSRPVTAAMSGGAFTPVNVTQAVDVVGFNYQFKQADQFHAAHPDIPVISSEDTSGLMTRGAWFTDVDEMTYSGDDMQAVPWGSTQRRAQRDIVSRPWLGGSFVWTGFDYHGEPSPHEWPAQNSWFGILDICGFPKNAANIRRAHWIRDKPVLAIAPHWTWPGREGQEIRVMVSTNARRVRLLLNGKEVASGPVDPVDMACFPIRYAAGRLEAIAYDDGREVARASVDTAGRVAALRLEPDRHRMSGDGWDAQPVTIRAVDDHGRTVPSADMVVRLNAQGLDQIGVCNGNPVGPQVDKADSIALFHGLAQVIVRTRRGSRGSARLMAKIDALAPARCDFTITPGEVPSVSATTMSRMVTEWRQTQVRDIAPDPTVPLRRGDANSSTPVTAGIPVSNAPQNGFVLMTASFELTGRMVKQGAQLRFGGIAGVADIWLDGHKLSRKSASGTAPFSLNVPPGESRHNVALLIEAVEAQPYGLPGFVYITER